MATIDDIPILLILTFGETAGTAHRAASSRLLLWSRAFEDWLAEREHTHSQACRKQSQRAWRRLYKHCDRMPWDIRQTDIAVHLERLVEEGYKPKTAASDLSMLSNFFHWCAQKNFDPECEPFFNPCVGVSHPRVESFQVNSLVLSEVESDALLRLMHADRSPLGLRDYAFTLARLKLGVPLRELQRLQWDQISMDTDGVWVRWRQGSEPARLPEDVWEAIETFLEETGRIPGMTDESFIFTGIKNLSDAVLGTSQPEWSGKHLCYNQILRNLKLYGQKAGIPKEKLNMQTLRRTALFLHLKTDCSLEQTRAFMGWRVSLRDTRFRLQALKQIPEKQRDTSPPTGEEIEVPNRKPHIYRPGDGYIHGFHALSQPLEEIQAVLAEDIQGLDEQVSSLRALGRELLDRHMGSSEQYALMEMYGRVASWLSDMIRTEKLLAERGKDEIWVNEFLAGINRLRQDEGDILDRESLMKQVMESNTELELAAPNMREEIATLRFLLRNAFKLAIEAQDDKTYLRMVGLYGESSIRLARLLRRQKDGQINLRFYINKLVDQVLGEVFEGWKYN
jgi:site-specific recombinase XerD